jgi:hypothetical protein
MEAEAKSLVRSLGAIALIGASMIICMVVLLAFGAR